MKTVQDTPLSDSSGELEVKPNAVDSDINSSMQNLVANERCLERLSGLMERVRVVRMRLGYQLWT